MTLVHAPGAPQANRVDDGPEVVPVGSEPIDGTTTAFRCEHSLHDIGTFQLFEAGGEDVRRDAERMTQLCEAQWANQEIAHDEQRPPLGDDIGGPGHTAVLTGRAKEAADFYCQVFGTEITQIVPDGQGGVMLCTFALAGHDVIVLNGAGPEADIQSQRVTLQVHVDGQEEFDRYWYALLDGGNASKNGWLVDKFGIWWDIVPIQQMQIFSSATPEAMRRLAIAAQSMERIDIAELGRAAAGT